MLLMVTLTPFSFSLLNNEYNKTRLRCRPLLLMPLTAPPCLLRYVRYAHFLTPLPRFVFDADIAFMLLSRHFD